MAGAVASATRSVTAAPAREMPAGDFPGGRVELGYPFRLRDGLIRSLSIG
ncbi:MAG: hypothetical protein ABW000_25500 [Actinoplanes sp.]